ncbi:hypothetical protein IEQ34_005375 [Dendrobium chrysotoxum]|uniref:FMR1-interacting protein 1 conserved domain-containing protein n=1 Tax=Dendrobium chrysotoxum TaxID=161865 RepID=A0AAV7HBN1_DENCH|nr:hypothetical protein IEQ34_005375 [Dendrobium chrysotoxum]
MLPFIPPFPNQNQVQGGNDPSPNQFPRSSSAALPNQFGFNNPQILMPAMGGFNNQNALLGTLLAQQHLMQGLQNNFMGALLQQGIMPQLHGQQLNFLGALQSPNFMSLQQGGLLGRPPMGQNMNQMMGFSPNGLLCSQNPIFPTNSRLPLISSGNSNPGFLGNDNTQVGQSLSSSTGLETQISNQKLQEPILPSPLHDNKSNERKWPQLRHGQAGGKYFSSNSSENVASNNFKPKFNDQGKRKIQKSQSYNSRNTWQKERPFTRNNQRGHRKRKEKITNFSESSDNTSTMRKRPLSVAYSESEIQQWREARKKNFPTRTNIEKKLSPSKEDIDSCAKVRRQQLKEVLAKQAELGVEVAEIPSIYLTEPEEQTSKNVNASEALNTNIETSCKLSISKKRGRFRRNKRNAKRLKFRNEAVPAHEPLVKKREPTLLRKLLNGDIRHDKCQLLQAFRFMVLNTFFKGVPDKPLLFPIVTTKDDVPESKVFVEKKPFQDRLDSDANFLAKNGNDEEVETTKYSTVVGAVKGECDEDNDFDGASNVVCETIGEDFILHDGDKSEEGEITN